MGENKINTMKQERLKFIKELSNKEITLKSAAQNLGYSERRTRRKLKEYRVVGPKAFTHKNTNKIPINKITQAKKDEIIKLYEEQFYDFSMLDFWEVNFKDQVSYTTLRNIMIEVNKMIFTMNRKTKKIIRQNLKLTEPDSDFINYKNNEAIKIAKHPHPAQTKLKFFGEIFEADASNHQWIKGFKSHLHIVIDKATKNIVGGHFSEQETTESYYKVFENSFIKYGIPRKIVTDNRNVFSSKNNRNSVGNTESCTQLQFIFHSLHIVTKTTSIPQEKALVERTFGTLQKRWPQKIRMQNIKSIEELNEFLPKLIEEYNNRFAIPINDFTSVVEEFKDDPNSVFAYRSTRIVNNGHIINFKNKEWYICTGFEPLFLKPKTSVLISETKNGKYYASVGNDVFKLLLIDDPRLHETLKSIGPEEFEKEKLPKIANPWRDSNWYFFNKKAKNKRRIY